MTEDGSDRIEELEQTVSELEATVRGLTEELVDANERIRLLERRVGGNAGSAVADEGNRSEESAASADGEREAEREIAGDDAAEAAVGTDAQERVEGSKPTESEGSDGEESSDDIIVA